MNGSQIEDRSYDALGRLTSTDRPSVDESRTYFDNGQVQTIANGAVGTATYAYDANGNKQSESWSGAMSAWNFTTQSAGAAFPGGYDNEDRFMNFVQSGQSKTSLMTRSNIGNISNVSLNGSTTSRSYSNVHELESVGGSSQSYDADGNLSTSLTGTSFDWDASGMMTTANVNGGPTVEYGYDASGKRVWKKVTDGGAVTETVFIHAGPNCIAEYTKGAPAGSSGNEYIYAGGIDSLVMLSRSGASQNLAITRNQQWSVSALVSAGGSVVERYTYDLFGKRTILAANGSTVRPSSNYAMNYGYTSRRHEDETGLMHFRARFYDPNTGEFISRDPLEYIDGMSQYRGYFIFRGIDPTGLLCRCGWVPITSRNPIYITRPEKPGKTCKQVCCPPPAVNQSYSARPCTGKKVPNPPKPPKPPIKVDVPEACDGCSGSCISISGSKLLGIKITDYSVDGEDCSVGLKGLKWLPTIVGAGQIQTQIEGMLGRGLSSDTCAGGKGCSCKDKRVFDGKTISVTFEKTRIQLDPDLFQKDIRPSGPNCFMTLSGIAKIKVGKGWLGTCKK